MALTGTWDLFGQRLRRYELYFDGRHTETIRGPLVVEGVGLRLFEPLEGQNTMTIGFQATTELSGDGLAKIRETAHRLARHTMFPAPRVELPGGGKGPLGAVEVVDHSLWEDPMRRVEEFASEFMAAFPTTGEPAPSFGSVKVTLVENSLVNSSGLSLSYPETQVEIETAVKSAAGPEGAPPGEYWVTRTARRLPAGPSLKEDVSEWCQRAQDVRRAKAPPSGQPPVGLPAPLLSEILPHALALRFSGSGRLRQIAVETGRQVASESLSIRDDPAVPWSPGSTPVDDEGTIPTAVSLIEKGVVQGLTYDCLHAGAFGTGSSGAAYRHGDRGVENWYRFVHRPRPSLSTLVLPAGAGGTDAELIEEIEDGVWVDQLGWPHPDPLSSAFGGEIRLGYRIRHGHITEPVRGGTVGGLTFGPVGEAPSLLGGVRAIGSRATLVGELYSPSLIVDGLTVSGKGGP